MFENNETEGKRELLEAVRELSRKIDRQIRERIAAAGKVVVL